MGRVRRPEYEVFALNIKTIYKAWKLTEETLGELLGVSRSTVSNWTTAYSLPAFHEMRAMLSGKFKTGLKRLKKEGKLSDITGLQFYSLKDSLAIHLLDNGVDPESAMRHLRQRDLTVFQRYVKRLGIENEKVRRMPVGVLPKWGG